MPVEKLHKILKEKLQVDFPETLTCLQLQEQLTVFISGLIAHDFQKLINILYQVDVREDKLKEMLAASTGVDAAEIIAAMIIERMLEKIETRKQHKGRREEDNEEKW